jgi:putative heme-binding domain-containing protein
MKNDMQCAKCHMVRGQGGQIGPDLSMIGKKASRENLLESILLPSKAVADQYVNWQIETGKGLVLNGLIVEETPQYVVLRDANGKDNKVNKKDIENRTKSPKSLMPEDIVVFLSEEDLIDITEYMLTLKTASLTPTSWNIVGPFNNGSGDEGIDKVFPPEKEVDLKGQYDGKGGKVGWTIVRPDGTGYVDLMKHFSGSGEIVSYLHQEIESPADQEATILIGHDDACKVFLNGEKVHEDRQHVAAKPETHQVKVKLKKGVNKVLVKINNGSGPHGLYFTLVAEQELKQRN